MQNLVYPKAGAKGATLADELIANVPELAPVSNPHNPDVQLAVFSLACTPSEVRLHVPDDAPEPAIAAVVAAHDPSKPSPQEEDEAAAQAVYVKLTGYLNNWDALLPPEKDDALQEAVKGTVYLLGRLYGHLPIVTQQPVHW